MVDFPLPEGPTMAAVRADRGHGLRPHITGKVADDRDIRGVEELAEYGRGGDGQRKARYLIPQRTVQHVQPLFSRISIFHIISPPQ